MYRLWLNVHGECIRENKKTVEMQTLFKLCIYSFYFAIFPHKVSIGIEINIALKWYLVRHFAGANRHCSKTKCLPEVNKSIVWCEKLQAKYLDTGLG